MCPHLVSRTYSREGVKNPKFAIAKIDAPAPTLSKTPSKVSSKFTQCGHLSSINVGNFFNFQTVPSIIVANFIEFQSLSSIIVANFVTFQCLLFPPSSCLLPPPPPPSSLLPAPYSSLLPPPSSLLSKSLLPPHSSLLGVIRYVNL